MSLRKDCHALPLSCISVKCARVERILLITLFFLELGKLGKLNQFI
jgi:hypothetical protein